MPDASKLLGQVGRSHEASDGSTGWCTGTTTSYPLSCTATERAGCHITAHLSKLNEFLWNARLELCSLPGKFLGHFALVSIDEPSLPEPKRNQIRPAATLAHRLLKAHPCVAALNISTDSFKGSEALLRDALQDNLSIRSFKIHFSGYVRRKDFCSAIPSLTNLEELECSSASECPIAFCTALTEVLRKATSLRALRLPEVLIKGSGANDVLAALTTNGSLEELWIHGSVIGEASREYRSIFSKYIAASRSLTKLCVGSCNVGRQSSLKWILQGLLENRTVTDASITDFLIDPESAALMSKVLARNNVLRRLNITILALDAWTGRQRDVASTADYSSWLQALAENRTLEAVTLPLRICEPDSWAFLFTSLSAKNSRMKLTVSGQCSERYLWEKVCEALAGSGAEENVVFDTCVYVLQNSEIIRCRAFSQFYAFPCRDTWGEVYRTLILLPSLAHITSAHLEIWLPDVDQTLSKAIARYIQTTATLTKLHLTVWLRNVFREPTEECWRAICEALSQNVTIKELRIGARYMDDDEVRLLVDAVKSSGTIRKVQMTAGEAHIAIAFARCLRFGIEDNYKLVKVVVDGCVWSGVEMARDLFAIHATVRRNADIVVRASLFVGGVIHDRYGAVALERVERHSTLLAELAEQMSLSNTEAAAMVSLRLRSIESMDDFMRLAGVVRERVECHAVEDGRKQLDSLNEYCWRVVRRFLRLEDISW